jgi:folate-dependent phosphoribosylglycinamide formyltransferase PurN/peptidoglycan/xylan/chitin deacetylase (PgdA/CDA1 family)
MKIALLTSDILDGLIVAEKLISDGRELGVIIYENKKRTAKYLLKRLLYRAKGVISGITYGSIAKDVPDIVVKNVDDINSPETKRVLEDIRPDLIAVVGTRKLDKGIYGLAGKGAINLHSGILPYYRGADSEFWALYNNDIDKIGVTIHFVDEKLDAGDIILMEVQRVSSSDDHRKLRMKNIILGAAKMSEAIALIEKGGHGRKAQDDTLARVYRSAAAEDKAEYRKRSGIFRKRNRKSVLKEFGRGAMKATERVVKEPSFLSAIENKWGFDIFCLRIDADEYDAENFSSYYALFEKYREAITIFVNANSFKNASGAVMKCREMGLDIQSHGYYHHTYNSYKMNRFNISKAKEFFKSYGIETKGFAAPMGKWNEALMSALEDEGYLYSSDFSYDYTGLPNFPLLKGKWSRVLELPVFPVAPELFYKDGSVNLSEVVDYYKSAIDRMSGSGIPCIVYAHTNPACKEMPFILDKIAGYALNVRKLKPVTMTRFSEMWTREREKMFLRERGERSGFLPEEFAGREIREKFVDRLKASVKDYLDFERITPKEDLKCGSVKKYMKLAARGILG